MCSFRSILGRSSMYSGPKKALLAEADQNVYQLAKENYDRQMQLFQKQVIAQATLDTYSRNLETSRQTLVGAKADEERARLAYGVNIAGVNTTVARLRSELAD